MTEQEKRRAAFQKKAEVGYKRNEVSLSDCHDIAKRYQNKELMFGEALGLAWAAGCTYGKEHAEELKVFDKVEQAKETAETFKELTPFQEALIQFGLEFSKYYNEYGNVQDLTKDWTDDLLKLASENN